MVYPVLSLPRERSLSLPLFVAGVTLADDAHHATSANDLAMFADWLDAGSYLHFSPHRQFVAELSSITLFQVLLKE